MAKIDHFVRSIGRFSAQALVLASDSHIVLRFAAGDRHATQSTPHAQLVEIIQEIADNTAKQAISAGHSTSIDHWFESTCYKVKVEPAGGRWTVSVEPGQADSIAMPTVEAPDAPDASSDTPGAAPGAATVSAPATPVARPSQVATLGSPDRERPRRRPTKPSNRWIDQLLIQMIDRDASDVHLSSNSKPYFRIHGEMAMQPGDDLAPAFLLEKLMEIAPKKNREEFGDKKDTDFGYAVEGLSRFRVNVFEDRNGPGAVLRAIPHEIPEAKKLGVPEKVLDLCNLTKGLVLVTGPTGSGKSTTLAALIDHINRTRADHLITIEDPIEFVHPNRMCLVNQREVHTHTNSFQAALRAALREDPDIVLIGEMRDLETIAMAVETAETGHLVFGTLHTSTAPSTVDRIIDQFPADRQEQIRQMLAKSLKGVIAQTLCKRIGGGRVAAYEILFGTSAVENLIRERKTFQLFSVMQTGRNQGMCTLGDALLALVKNKQVEPLEAYRKAVNKTEFKNLLTRAGIQLDL